MRSEPRQEFSSWGPQFWRLSLAESGLLKAAEDIQISWKPTEATQQQEAELLLAAPPTVPLFFVKKILTPKARIWQWIFPFEQELLWPLNNFTTAMPPEPPNENL